MIRLLRRTFLLGGVLMLTLSAVLASAAREKTLSVNLVSVNAANVGGRFYSYVPVSHALYPITPVLTYPDTYGLSPDGMWVYIYNRGGYDLDQPMSKAGVYRVRLDGRVIQLITPEQVRSDVWWVNQHWIIYVAYDVELQRQVLIKRSLTGNQRQVVMDWTSPYMPTSVLLSPDSTQIAYTLSLKDGAEADVLIVPVAGGQPRNLTEQVDGELTLRLWTTGDEWLLAMTRDYRLLGLRSDGSDVQTIVPSSMSRNLQFGLHWADAAQLLLVLNANKEVFMLHIGQVAPVWTQSGYAIITPDEQHVILQASSKSYLGTIWKMPIAGGERYRVATIPNMYLHAVLSPDGQSLLIASGSADYSTFYISKLNLQDGSLKTLYSDQVYYLGYDWSSDGAWVSVAESTDIEGLLIVMRPDGKDRRAVRFLAGPFYQYPSWYHGKSADWPSRTVVLIGIGLIASALVGGVVFRQVVRMKTRLSANRQKDME